MTTKRSGLVALVHRALAEIHEAKYTTDDDDIDMHLSLADGYLRTAIDLFGETKIDNEQLRQYANTKTEELLHELSTRNWAEPGFRQLFIAAWMQGMIETWIKRNAPTN